MSQTAYNQNTPASFAGMLADFGANLVDSRLNEESIEVAPGLALIQGTADDGAKVPASITPRIVGVSVSSFAHNNRSLTNQAAFAAGDRIPTLIRGRIFVLTEQTVTPADPVYVRFATGSGGSVKGSFRKDPDGVAEVHTLTPTAVNTKIYVVRVAAMDGKIYVFEFISSGAATATEICNGLRAAMAADAAFTALIGATGTTTVILTPVAAQAGKAYTVASVGDGVVADVVTTPAAATAALAKGFRWVNAGTAAGLTQIELNANTQLSV